MSGSERALTRRIDWYKGLENSFKNDINLVFLPLKNDNKNNIEPLIIDNNMIQFKQEIRHVTKRNLE